MSHVTGMNESCHRYERVMSHICMRHVKICIKTNSLIDWLCLLSNARSFECSNNKSLLEDLCECQLCFSQKLLCLFQYVAVCCGVAAPTSTLTAGRGGAGRGAARCDACAAPCMRHSADDEMGWPG